MKSHCSMHHSQAKTSRCQRHRCQSRMTMVHFPERRCQCRTKRSRFPEHRCLSQAKMSRCGKHRYLCQTKMSHLPEHRCPRQTKTSRCRGHQCQKKKQIRCLARHYRSRSSTKTSRSCREQKSRCQSCLKPSLETLDLAFTSWWKRIESHHCLGPMNRYQRIRCHPEQRSRFHQRPSLRSKSQLEGPAKTALCARVRTLIQDKTHHFQSPTSHYWMTSRFPSQKRKSPLAWHLMVRMQGPRQSLCRSKWSHKRCWC